MRNLRRRIEQLEQAMGAIPEGVQVMLTYEGVELALDFDRCADILTEAGFVGTGPGLSVLDFSRVPHGLSAVELERYLREHGDEICCPKRRGYSVPTASRL
jgi:hypothetical protein